MTIPDLLTALRADPALALGLHGALCDRRQPPAVNVAIWLPGSVADGRAVKWHCETLARVLIAEAWDGGYWHAPRPYFTGEVPCSSTEAGIALCSEALTAAGWVVHRPDGGGA